MTELRHADGWSGGAARLLAWVAFVLCALHALPARADALDEVRRSGKLLWGGDQEGGGPYVFPREDNPSEVTGFEVDLAAKIGEYLKVKAEFTQGQWDKMPDMLRTGKVHVIINGYELTPERLDVMAATMPYYVYALQLLLRRGDPEFKGWDDLKRAPGGNKAKVGVLTGSAAEEYMKTFCGEEACTVIPYDGNTDSMREVETRKLDATLQDTPIAAFYAPRFPGLAPVGKPVGRGYYVMYVRRGDGALLQSLNEAIVILIGNGEIERIYRRYGIWDEQQAELAAIAADSRFFGLAGAVRAVAKPAAAPAAAASVSAGPAGSASAGPAGAARAAPASAAMPSEQVVKTSGRKRGWQVVTTYAGVMLKSAGLTVVLSALSFPLAVLVGLLIAVGRLYGPRWLRTVLTAYVELLRGTPVMLQLYFIFFFLPEVGVVVPAFWTGIVGLAVNYSAYESEIYRAGLQAVPRGQMEAALSLGMSRALAVRRIVVPQAVRIVIPPVVNDFIALFKDTSVCSVVTLVELTKRFSVLSQSTQSTPELMAMTAALYMAMSYPLAVLSRWVERRLGVETKL